MRMKLVCGARVLVRRARPFARALAPALAFALPALALPAPARAQVVSAGVAIGRGSVPVKYFPVCGAGTDQEGTLAGDLRAAVRLSTHLGVEARAGGYATASFNSCAVVFPPPPEGLSTRPDYPTAHDGTGTIDLRVRYRPIPRLIVTAGVGRLNAVHTPYLVLGPGIRVGGGARLIVDYDALLARFLCDMVTVEGHDGQVVREISRSHGHEWRHLTAVRLGLELDLGPRVR